jgi:DNA polymerase elongation subunit (family B)
MGIETARSSTPAFVRTALKKAVNMILCENDLTLQQFVKEINKTFCSLPPEEVAFPRSVSKMKDYASCSTIYKKATPIAVKAALIHNHLSKKHKLDKKIKAIGEGEKMKFLYLKSPNPVRETVIGFTSSLPREFDVHKYIDYTMQFNKSFLEPLRTITTAIGWSPEHRSTLDSFFT